MKKLQHRIVLVVRKTRLEELIARFNTVAQARFYIEHLGADFADYEAEQRIYQQAVRDAEAALSRHARVHRLDRGFLPNYLFAPDTLVVVLGQDGLVANTLKYLDGQAVIGVNPDPARWDGPLLPFAVSDLAALVPEALGDKRPCRDVTMAQAKLSDGQQLLAVNDLFIGPRSHVSARYEIRLGEQVETHSSSGIIVSTGLGSTGWLRSLLAGAAGMLGSELPPAMDTIRKEGLPWDTRELCFSVREPFPSRGTQAGLVFGMLSAQRPLTLVSQMAGHGVIFSDGMEADFLEFNAGMTASITLARTRGRLVV